MPRRPTGTQPIGASPGTAARKQKTGRLAMVQTLLTRRRALILGTALLGAPYVWSRPARAAGQVVVRNPGGAWSDTQKQYIYDPFTKETGIEVVIVASTLTKMLAMAKSGN